MKMIGLTGGMGSGKSTVGKVLEALGYPVYNSDDAGKKAYQDAQTKNQILSLLGENVLDEKGLFDFKKVAALVFNNDELLKKLNGIIHPYVNADFKTWLAKQKNELVFKESALLIESDAVKNCDAVIVVVADEELRVQRLLKRDSKLTKEAILKRLEQQLSDEQRINFADFVIQNNHELLLPQILKVLNTLSSNQF